MARATLEDDWPRTVTEFQIWHARQPERWEFVDGRPRLMALASMTHSIIKRNVLRALDRALADSGCEVLVDGPQILTDEISAIPDVVVTCAPIDLSTPVVTEPTIIVEVMWPSSEADDTLRKWFSYRKIASLKQYLVLAQDRRLVQIHSRAGDLWRERFVSEGVIELDDPPLRMEFAGLYAATEMRRRRPDAGPYPDSRPSSLRRPLALAPGGNGPRAAAADRSAPLPMPLS